MAKGCFDVQQNDFGERPMLFRRSFIIINKRMLIRDSSKFLLALTRNMSQNIPTNFSPWIR